MTYDPTATYRSTQVASSSPAARIVLLYQGAIRFGSQHLSALECGDGNGAHYASIRCQAIVAGLQEALDLSAGPLAFQLDQLYGFVLRRLVEGNLTRKAAPTEEALAVLRGLLGTWQEIACLPVVSAGPMRQLRPAAGVMGTALS